jgi:hypothetical protein
MVGAPLIRCRGRNDAKHLFQAQEHKYTEIGGFEPISPVAGLLI